jgi:hypothetical protein
MNWLLNLIGVLIFFINRFNKRTKKTVAFSLRFWITDNFQEMATTLLLNLALMIILQININEGTLDLLLAKLPAWVNLLGVPGICFALGAGLSWLLYELFRKKVKDAKG